MKGFERAVYRPGSLVAMEMPMVMEEMEKMEEILLMEEPLLIKATKQMPHRSMPKIYVMSCGVSFYGWDFLLNLVADVGGNKGLSTMDCDVKFGTLPGMAHMGRHGATQTFADIGAAAAVWV